MKLDFNCFLFTEENNFFGTQAGDILTALQNLSKDAENMGKRHLMRLVINIVKQIRRILHGSWTYEERKHLKTLQKIGVALMKGTDTNQDLVELIHSSADELEKLIDKIHKPINSLGAPY